MPDDNTRELINQLTLRKLHFTRELLRTHNLKISGTAEVVRARLHTAVDEGQIEPAAIEALLNELDHWGDQRLRIGRFEQRFVELYADVDAISQRVREAGMEEVYGRHGIDLSPPPVLTPMSVEYAETDAGRILRVVAAKTRTVDRPARDLPELRLSEEPELQARVVPAGQEIPLDAERIVYKPFRREEQKAVSFAELNLETGFVLTSTTLLRYGTNYTAEFEELYELFASFIPLGAAEPTPLFDAVKRIRELPLEEVRIYSRRSRTRVGGTLDLRSHSSRDDVRSDPGLEGADTVLAAAEGLHCNCRWQASGELDEEVHTHILAPAGEISVLGQVTESSVRHVLQRVRDLN